MVTHPVSSSGLAGEAANFRRFNRMYTRFIGTLNEGLLNSDYSLAEARVLYELANRVAPKASDIAEGLGVDPAYLSRMLGKFERDGLLRKKTSEQDGRYDQHHEVAEEQQRPLDIPGGALAHRLSGGVDGGSAWDLSLGCHAAHLREEFP